MKTSVSHWANQVFLVPKKGGSSFCVNYRRLNSATRWDIYLLPHLYDALDDTRYFTSLITNITILAALNPTVNLPVDGQ